MKSASLFWVGVTTMLLIMATIMSTMNFPFNWVFYCTVIGQILIVYMVYKVLTEDYKTQKTFEDFYEDYPIGKRLN